MIKHLPLICIALILVGGGSFVKAEEPPYYLLFRHDAKLRLEILEQKPNTTNSFERLVLYHNLAFHKDKVARGKAQDILKKYFKNDMTPLVMAYRSSLKMLEVRDRNTVGNTWKMTKTFFGLFGDDPYEEAGEAFQAIRQAIAKDSNSIQLRLLSLTAAVESAEHLDGLLQFAYQDLQWLKAKANNLDSTEVFFYALSWAKYAYKYALIKEMPDEASKGFIWLSYAEQFALRDVYCEEVYTWWIKIDSIVIKK